MVSLRERGATRTFAGLRIALGLACVLILAGSAALALERASAGSTDVAPTIEVRGTLAGIMPGGQSTGFAVAADGSLGVVDRVRQRVIRLDPRGQVTGEWGPRLEPAADAQDLSGLAVGPNGDWFVLDRGRLRIDHLDPTGASLGSMDLSPLATYGPNGLAVDARGDVFLADTGGNRVLDFSPSGSIRRTIGAAGSGLGQLKQPMGMSFGPDGAMYVADFENSRIEAWTAALEPGHAWSVPHPPFGVAVDGLGRVFVPDTDQRLVRVYSADGELLAEIGGLGVNAPSQVGVAPDGSGLWVLGSDGLAHVDLGPYAQLGSRTSRVRVGTPLLGLGAALLALSGLGLVVTRRRKGSGPAREGSVGLRDGSVARREASAHGARATRWRELSARARGRVLAGGGMLLGGLAGVALAQWTLGQPTAKDHPWPMLAVFVASGGLWAIGYFVSARALPLGWIAGWHPGPSEGRALVPDSARVWLASGAIVLGTLSGALWWHGQFETQQASIAAWIWLVAIGLALLASLDQPRRPTPLDLLPLVLFGVALVPRVWQVGDLPFGIWFDEAQGFLEIRRVLHQGTYTPILNTYGRDTSGFFYLGAALWPWLGDTIAAGRTAAAIVGSLAAAATFALGRELFGWRVGLAAGLLLALSRWELDFARLAFNPISLVLCAALAMWLLARAVRTGRVRDYALAGAGLGIGMHAYTGFRGMPAVALGALACAALIQRWRIRIAAERVGMFVMCAVLTALPVVIFAVQDPAAFNGRTAQTLILAQPLDQAEKLRQIWETLQRHALMFTVSGDMNGRHNLPGAPMLDPISSGLLALGLGWVVVRCVEWRSLLLLGWAGVALSGGVLTLAFEAPQAVRTIGITPVLCVLLGLGLVGTLERAACLVCLPRVVRVRRATLAMAGVAAVLVAAIGDANLRTFFDRQMRDGAVWAAFSTRETFPARATLASGGSDEAILASATMVPSVQIDFLVPPALRDTLRRIDPAADLPYRGQGPALVFLETEHDQALADEVARIYPDAPHTLERPPDGGPPIVESFSLPADVLARHAGVLAEFRGADGQDVRRSDIRPSIDPSAAPAVAYPAHATWTADLAIDDAGVYGFRVPNGWSVEIDRAPTANGSSVRLVRGAHALRVDADLAPAAASAGELEWRPPGVPGWEPIARQALFQPRQGGPGLRLTLSQPAGPTLEYVDPVLAHYFHVSPFASAHADPPRWTAEWRGSLIAPSSGSYGIALEHSQHAAVWIDDRLVFSDLETATMQREDAVALAAGPHPLRVRFDKTEDSAPLLYLRWRRPGAGLEVVPGEALFPEPPEAVR